MFHVHFKLENTLRDLFILPIMRFCSRWQSLEGPVGGKHFRIRHLRRSHANRPFQSRAADFSQQKVLKSKSRASLAQKTTPKTPLIVKSDSGRCEQVGLLCTIQTVFRENVE